MKRISRVSILSCIIAIILLSVNSLHVFTEWVSNAPGETFTGIAHYFADYFLYVSLIAQGTRGATIFTEHLFTNESLGGTWIYWLYTVIGKGGVIGIPPFALYNISLILFAGALLYLWWRLAGVLFPKQPVSRLVAFLFVTTASHIPGRGDFWFSPTPALNRLGGVPHQILQSILLVSVIMMFSEVQSEKRPGVFKYASLGVLSFVAATANPIQMFLVIVSGIMLLAVKYLIVPRNTRMTHPHVDRKYGTPGFGRLASLFLSFAGSALLGALLTNNSFSRDPILAAAKVWEDSQRVSVGFLQFLFAIGPITLLIPFGIKPILREKSPLLFLLGSMGAFSVIVFFSPLPALLNTSPVRWLSPVSYAIFPILAVYGLSEIVNFLGAEQKWIPAPVIRDMLILIFICITVPSLVTQSRERSMPLRTDNTIHAMNHLSSGITAVLNVLQTAPGKDTVLVDPALPYDALIPITGKRTFTGHPIHTLYPETKEGLRRSFFEGNMSEAAARNFFKDHRIRYILIRDTSPPTLHRYPMLHETLKRDGLILYERND